MLEDMPARQGRSHRRQWPPRPTYGILTIALFVLIALRSAAVIEWSWGLVLLPLWFYLGMLVLLAGLVITAKIAEPLAERMYRRRLQRFRDGRKPSRWLWRQRDA